MESKTQHFMNYNDNVSINLRCVDTFLLEDLLQMLQSIKTSEFLCKQSKTVWTQEPLVYDSDET